MNKNEKDTDQIENTEKTVEKPFILRAWLKDEAVGIRKLKEEIKVARGTKASTLQSKLHYKRQQYRCHHIACCELFGRTREEIETPNAGNEPNETAIESAKYRYDWTLEAINAYKAKQGAR